MSTETLAEKRMPLWRKIGYGIGDLGSNYCWSFVAGFVLIYFTNTLGISSAIVGSMMMVSRVLDGITDVFMGQIIDRTRVKMGKARFWYLLSCFPVAITTFLIFNVPNGLAESGQYVYIFIMYTLLGAVFYTMNNIAYSSLIALCTKNPKDRVSMTSNRYMFAIVGVLLINSTTMNFVERFGGGQAGWRATSLLYAAICFITLIIPVFCVKELPAEEMQVGAAQENTTKDKLGMGKSFLLLLKNKFFLIILAIYLFNYLGSGITQGVGVYFATYNLGDATLLGALSMAQMLPTVFAMPFMPKLTEKFGIQKTCVTGMMLGVVGSIVMLFGQSSFSALMIGMAIRSIGVAPMTASLNTLIAATDDYSYLRYNHRMTSTIYSCSSVGIKVGTGLGTALTGIILQWGGFNGLAETQTADALATVRGLYVLPLVISAVALLLLLIMLRVEDANKKLQANKMAPAAA